MDVLTDILQRSRAQGAVFSHTTVRGEWGLAFPPRSGLAVHAVTDGRGSVLVTEGEPPIAVAAGEIVLVRGELAHSLASSPQAECIALDEFVARSGVPGSPLRFEVRDPAGAPTAADPATVFLCGAYRFAGDLCSSLLASLPAVVHVRPAAGSRLRAALDLLARELVAEDSGQQVVLDRLLDVVLVGMLREHLSREGAQAPAWFTALGDPQVAGALRLLHEAPADPWTVATLAAAVGLSRAAFARRFAAQVGEAPLEYLTRWRMALARERLADGAPGLAAVAQEVGYSSEFAFAAAFKRHHGEPPGRWRARARAS